MSYSREDVNTVISPSLFPGGALSITLEALLDPLDYTVLFVVRAYDVPSDKLIALWSSSPVGYDNHSREVQRALNEFGELLRTHTGPF